MIIIQLDYDLNQNYIVEVYLKYTLNVICFDVLTK